jgi:tetratricopeptide (TPR) repeat protein
MSLRSISRVIVIILFDIFLCLFLVEIGLRIRGYIYLSLQEKKNQAAIMQKTGYRIMCLGESITFNGYPRVLEKILNQSGIGTKFQVVDKGVPGASTSAIVGRLEDDLNKYRPDMVIVMMGAFDPAEIMLTEEVTGSKKIAFLRSLKIYRLIKLLWLQGIPKKPQAGFAKIQTKSIFTEKKNLISIRDPFKKARELSPKRYIAYLELGRIYRGQGKFFQAEESFKKARELNPKRDIAYLELGRLYRDQGQLSRAEDFFKQAIELSPERDVAYLELGRIYRGQGKFFQAEESFKKARELSPERDGVYLELGRIYRDQGKFSQAEDSFKQAIELSPERDVAYLELGRLYRDQGQLSQAEDVFKQAIELSPEKDGAYLELGRLYRDQGQFAQAEDFFKQAIEHGPEKDGAYLELGSLYRSQGKFSQAEDFLKKAVELNPRDAFSRAHKELAWCYISQGKLSETEALYKKTAGLNPGNHELYLALQLLYAEMGNQRLAREYGMKAQKLDSEYYSRLTISNYHELKEILDKKGIRLVCVQYPLRSLEPLKKIFEGQDGIIFVDNEGIFREAVRESRYQAYFTDTIGADFGHCTDEGHRLLAGNIARVIIKEVFRK